MLEVWMLSGNEGELVSVSVEVDPRSLESLLEALANVTFPINPQIFHGTVTTVEFPAYETRLEEVRRTLAASGFDPASVHSVSMLEKVATAAHSGF
jgi:hypothetical protein